MNQDDKELVSNGTGTQTDPDGTRSFVKAETESMFRPKEPEPQPRPFLKTPLIGIDSSLSKEQLMNSGVASGAGLVGADCTETGGADGSFRPVQGAAMNNAVRVNMPKTLEQQLALFKDEPKRVEDPMYVPDSVTDVYEHVRAPEKQAAAPQVVEYPLQEEPEVRVGTD